MTDTSVPIVDGPERGEGEPPPEAPADAWSIKGSTAPVGDRTLQVAAWVVGSAEPILVATTAVESGDNSFSIAFQAEDFVPGVVDFVVATLDPLSGARGAATSIDDAKRETILTDPLPLPGRQTSYGEMRSKITKVLTDRGEVQAGSATLDGDVDKIVRAATDEGIDLIAAKADISNARVRLLRDAIAANDVGLSTAVAVVLVGAGLPLDLEGLLSEEDQVRNAIGAAVADGSFTAADFGTPSGADSADHVIKEIIALQSLADLHRPLAPGRSTMQVLVNLVGVPVKPAELVVLAESIARHGVNADLWDALKTQRWRTAADREALRHAVWLDEVTLSSLPVVAHIRSGSEVLTPTSALELGVDGWSALVEEAETEGPSIPERFRTGSKNAQRRKYAAAILAALRRAWPKEAARVLVAQVGDGVAATDHPLPQLAARLASDPGFDVLEGDLSQNTDGLRERQIVRRALSADEPAAEVVRLAAIVVRPSMEVARMGQRASVKRDGEAAAYRDAAFANAALLTMFSDLRAAAVAPRAEDRTDLADWAELFGEVDDTVCEHCSSVYSPGAYLVDILRFVRDRGLGDALLSADRRPDLESIRLDCVNTKTPLPYIDLVNEVLESAVLMSADIGPLPPVGQTTTTSAEELRAHPEHLDARAYDHLRTAVHPFSIPFDLWEAEGRSYLDLVGVDRSEVRRLVAGGDRRFKDELGLFDADLDILDGSANVVPDYSASTYKKDANRLLRLTGLGFEELAELLATDYVQNGDGETALDLDANPETIGGGFGINHGRRIHRMQVLSKRMDVDIATLDRLLAVVEVGSKGEVRERGLAELATMKRMGAAMDLPLDRVALLFTPTVDTRRDASGSSDFDEWFAKPSEIDDRVPPIFTLNRDRSALAQSSALVEDNDAELRTALGLDEPDFAGLQEEVDSELHLGSLADLRRWVVLADGLALSIDELRSLARISAQPPFVREDGEAKFDVAATEAFVAAARALADAGASVERAESILLNPLTEAERTEATKPIAKLAELVAGTTATEVDDEAGLNELLEDALAEALDLDKAAVQRLIDSVVVTEFGVTRTVRETMLATGSATDASLLLACDRLIIAASLVQVLGLPSHVVEALFDKQSAWLDPNTLPVAPSDLATEQERPLVDVGADAAVHADATGAATVPLVVTVDGEPAGSDVEWRSIGEAEVSFRYRSGAWVASVQGVGEVTLVASVPSTENDRAGGIGVATVHVRAEDRWPSRTAEGLLALYQFHEGSGGVVSDVSQVGEPLDLTIEGEVTWGSERGLHTGGAALIASDSPATKIIDAVKASGEITIEAWVTPAEQSGRGPARMVTISADPHLRNATLAQRGEGFVARFRTDETGENGSSPATATSEGAETTRPVHVVYTRSAEGGRIYLDGVEATHQPRVKGTTDNWSDEMRLALGGEFGAPEQAGRHWAGTYHLVALFDRALAAEEVRTHADAGPVPALAPPVVTGLESMITMLPWESSSVSVDLNAVVASALPEVTTMEWSFIEGPAPVAFDSPGEASTRLSLAATGDYVVGLRARDRRDPDAWSLGTLAIRVAADPAGVPGRWDQFARALEFSRLAYSVGAELEQDSPALFDVHAEARRGEADGALTRSFLDELGVATGIGPRVDALVNDERIGMRVFGDAHDGEGITRIARVASFARRTGSAPYNILAWADETLDAEAAASIKTAVRSTFAREKWSSEVEDVRDALRAGQRDALVGLLLARGVGPLRFDSADEVYGHYLIDVEMSPCQLTSRLKQAMSSVQQFVQRTLLGIEAAAELKDDDAAQWKWMKTYRLWEANRKIFLHPENWLEPELRTDKSPFFAELESELAQADLTDESVTLAFEHYLEKLHGVAELEIVGVCQEHDGAAPTEPSVLHLIGRTRGGPKKYWHRTLTAGIEWSAWEAIDADVTGDHVIPVWHNSRLHLFWAEFQAKDVAPANMRNNANAVARRFAACRLSCVELRSSGWTAKTISDGEQLFWPTDERGRAQFVDTADPDFSPFSFHVSTDQATNDLVLAVAYRMGEEMLVWPGFELAATGNGLRPIPGGARRQRSDRPIASDRHIGFGFGSTASRHFQVMPAAEPVTGRTIPTLTGTSAPPVLIYNVTGESHTVPVFPQTVIILEFRRLTLEIEGRQRGWNVTGRVFASPAIRIAPPPPPQRFLSIVVTDVPEHQKGEVERWLRTHQLRVHTKVAQTIRQVRDFTLLADIDPPWSAVSSPRADLAFDQLPMVVQDRNGGVLVDTVTDPSNPRHLVGLTLLTHPLVGDMRRALNQYGVAGLLSAPRGDALRHQAVERAIGDSTTYRTDLVANVPTADLDFGIGDAFASYHWELFFHVPLLMAKLLMRNQRFDEAQRWLHFIFDPTAASKEGSGRDDPWQIKPFRRQAMEDAGNQLRELLESSGSGGSKMRDQVDYLLGQIHEHPFEPHVVARLRTSAYKKSVVMTYLDNLIAWADHLFTIDTLESLNEAAQLYVMAADILGERPAQKPSRQSIQLTAAELESQPPPAEIADVLSRVRAPSSTAPIGAGAEPPAISLELTFCVPPNPKLLGYWDVVADRLFKVRHCQNIQGIERALALFAPPIDPGALVRAAAAGTGGAGALTGSAVPTPHHRFRVLHGRAVAAAHRVRLLGGTLTHALEQRDTAKLTELLATQEVAMQRGTRSLLRLERDEAKLSLAALDESRRAVAAHKEFVEARADETGLEIASFTLATVGITVKTVAAVMHQVAGAIGTLPTFSTGAAGISSPVVLSHIGGQQIASTTEGIATGLDTTGNALKDVSDLVGRRAEVERRKAGFAQDKAQAAIDLARIDKEVEAAEKRVAIAEDNIATLEAVIENVEATRDVLRRRFTDEELWNWAVARASSLHFQAYSAALDLARRAERACQIELDLTDGFVSPNNWDSLRKGLLAGEGLLIDLTRMETAHLDGQRRRHEMTLRTKVSELGGLEALRRDGVVEIVIPETALDGRTPGHFLRKVKSVAVSVSGRGAAGSLPAKVTLLRSTTRTSADVSAGYVRDERRDDQRFVDDLLPSSIVTSGREEDTGLFDRSYDDDRYLPFEDAGVAESRWRIDLFPETDPPLGQLDDVELIIDYTALDGGEQLRREATRALA